MRNAEIKFYQDAKGKIPFLEWVNSIKDSNVRARIFKRIDRIVLGNLGDYRKISGYENLFELRFDIASGYRIYFSFDGKEIVLILGAGDKSTQNKDINKCSVYLEDYLRRKS